MMGFASLYAILQEMRKQAYANKIPTSRDRTAASYRIPRVPSAIGLFGEAVQKF